MFIDNFLRPESVNDPAIASSEVAGVPQAETTPAIHEATEQESQIQHCFENAAKAINAARGHESRAVGLLRKTTLTIFEAGKWLNEAHLLLKSMRSWCTWLDKYGIPRSTAWEAIELYRRAKTPEAIAMLSPTEAKLKYGIQKPRSKVQESPPSPENVESAALPRLLRYGADPEDVENDQASSSDTPPQEAEGTSAQSFEKPKGRKKAEPQTTTAATQLPHLDENCLGPPGTGVLGWPS